MCFMIKKSLYLLLFFVLILGSVRVEAQSENCWSMGSVGALSPAGLYTQGDADCAIGSDINGLTKLGYKIDPFAGLDYGLGPIRNLLEAAKFSQICMSEKGVFNGQGIDSGSTPQNKALFESELARCNTLLFGEKFIVYKRSFLNPRFTKAHMDLVNEAIQYQNRCIALMHYAKVSPSEQTGHVVEIVGVDALNEYDTKFTVADSNSPEDTFEINTNYINNRVKLSISDEYRHLMGYGPKTWIALTGVTLKCPIDQVNLINRWRNAD